MDHTAGWILIEAAVAIGSGAAAHKLSHSSRSSIEIGSAGVLLWRLNVEMRRGAESPGRVERRTSRTSGVLLFGLAIVAVVSRNLPPSSRRAFGSRPIPLVAAQRLDVAAGLAGKLVYGDRFYGINPSCIRCDYRRQGS